LDKLPLVVKDRHVLSQMSVKKRASYGLPLLLKTFSKNPFQGQYPTNAVSMNKAPPTMNRGFQRPGRKKPNGMRMTAKTIRPVLSAPATFLTIPMDAS
jgi:hypothetical protein